MQDDSNSGRLPDRFILFLTSATILVFVLSVFARR